MSILSFKNKIRKRKRGDILTKRYLKEVPFNLDGHPRGTVLLQKDNKVVVKYQAYDTEQQLMSIRQIRTSIRGPSAKQYRGYHLCGYVAIPKVKLPKSWHGNYDGPGLQYLNVHGGLTYAEIRGSYCIFGFDCAHAGDEENEDMYNPEYVMKLTEQMEEQIMSFAAIYPEWYASSDEERIAMLQKIRDSAETQEHLGFGALIDMMSGAENIKRGDDSK
jgi:hypothetical protein